MSTDASIQPALGVTDGVAATIELPDPPHRRPRWVPLIVGLPGLWLFPKTIGPHLAAGPWGKALLAWLVGLAGGTFTLLLAVVVSAAPENFPEGMPLLTKVRLQAARVVLDAAAGGSALPLLVIPGVILGSLIVATVFALALVPWMAAGDSAKSVYGRASRLALWLTTLVVPVPLLGVYLDRYTAAFDEEGGLSACAVVAYVLWVILRSGLRYAGPPSGPGFGPIEPRCESCGYRLCGLPPDGRCPECGLSVASSLRRYAAPTPVPLSRRQRFARRFRLIPRVIRRPDEVFGSLRVRFDAAEARRFWLTNWLALAAVVTLLVAADVAINREPYPWKSMVPAAFFSVLGLLAAQAAMAIVCTLGTLLRGRTSDLRISTIALGYGSAMLWPAALVLVAGSLVVGHLDASRLLRGALEVALLDISWKHTDILQAGVYLVMTALLVLWARRVDQAYRQLRHTAG